MIVSEQLRRLYSLDTLDKRFTTSSRTPPVTEDPVKETSPNGSTTSRAAPGTARSRWRTPEFFLYFLVIFMAITNMFRVAYQVSQESHPNYSKFEHLLSPGWIGGRKVDNSDSQYSGFRENIPFMLILLALHPALRQLYNLFSEQSKNTLDPVRPDASDRRLEQRASFDYKFAILFTAALHGVSAGKIFVILWINYKIATAVPRHIAPIATWVFVIGILFANELSGGYKFGDAAGLLLGIDTKDPKQSNGVVSVTQWLDNIGGLMPRWEVLFKMTALRLVSFNFDYIWSLGQGNSSPLEKKQLDPANLSERDRVTISANHQDFSFRNYVSYALYSPLYVAGPIVTFNDYISQSRHPLATLSTSRTVLYGIRFLITLLCMELMLHYIYAVAISKAQPAWEVYTPFQLSMLGYFNLHIIWLKLLLPWRFFRLWALTDGIDPPENMVRCMSDNYSALAFWRGWHRSLNRWIVRYIYIPLGGSTPPGAEMSKVWSNILAVRNFLLVFTFVALWHDINLTLLTWGWLVSLFVLPEVFAARLFPKRKWASRPHAYRLICGVGAVGNILMMMAANLVGFAVGLDGLKGLVQGIVGSYSGIAFLIAACVALFTGAQVMFEIREDEYRQGIFIKC